MNTIDDDLDLEVLRSIRADVVADPHALVRLRAAIVDAERPVPSPQVRRGRARLLAVAVGVLAVGAAAALIVPRMVITPGSAGAPPTASASRSASVLPTVGGAPRTLAQFTSEAARAEAARPASGVLTSGYRKVTSVSTTTSGPGGFITVDGRNVRVYLATRTTTTTWVPADKSAKWVQKSESRVLPTDDASREYLKAHPDLEKPSRSGLDRARNGHFFIDAKADWNEPDQVFIDSLPRDPAKLLARARAWNREFKLDDSPLNLLTILTIPLTDSWVEDPELRSALFTAIGKIKGIEVREGVVIGGRTGTALRGASTEDPSIWSEIVFDPNTYGVLGTHWHAHFAGAPERLDETTYVSELVDSAP